MFSKPWTAAEMGELVCPCDDVEIAKIADSSRFEIVCCRIRFRCIQAALPPPRAADHEMVLLGPCTAQRDVCLSTRQVGEVMSRNNFQNNVRMAPLKLEEVRGYQVSS